MSSALFKRSLEIVDEDFRSKHVKSIHKSQNNNRTSAFDLIPENHKLVKTVKHKGRRKTKHNEISETKKLTVDEVRKQISSRGDMAEENLNKLLKLSSFNKIEEKTVEKIILRAKAGHYVIPEVPKPVVEESIFTEEDFANLDKELFFDD